MRRKFLASVAAGSLLFAAMQPASAQLSQGEFVEALPQGMTDFFNAPLVGGLSLAAILYLIVTTFEDWTGIGAPSDRLAPTEPIIGQAPRSYVVPGAYPAAVPELYPDVLPAPYAPLPLMDHAALLNDDRQERAAEAMELTAEIMARRAEATATLQALQEKVRLLTGELGIAGALQAVTEAGLAGATSADENLRVLSELGQLEADERTAERWRMRHYQEWAKAHHPTLRGEMPLRVDVLPRFGD